MQALSKTRIKRLQFDSLYNMKRRILCGLCGTFQRRTGRLSGGCKIEAIHGIGPVQEVWMNVPIEFLPVPVR